MASINKSNPKKINPSEVKKFLSDAKYKIQLHSLVHSETEIVYNRIEALSVQTTQDVLGVAKRALIVNLP